MLLGVVRHRCMVCHHLLDRSRRQVAVHHAHVDPGLLEHLSKVGDLSKIDLFHVNLDGELAASLNATWTSYAHVAAYKPGKTPADLQPFLQQIIEVPKVEGSYGGVWGKAIEKDDHLLLYGWDDPKVRFSQVLEA